MARRTLWQIDMGDGTWSVCCMACHMALYRGAKPGADRAFSRHTCRPAARRPPPPEGPHTPDEGPFR